MALHVRPKYWLIAFMPICISITAIAWQKTGAGNANESQNRQDTLPSKNRHKITRVDKDTRDEKDLDKEMRKLDEALKNIDTKIDKIDWQKIQGEIQASMDKVNMEMKNHQVDMEQIQRQIDESVKSIDMDKIKKETALAMQHMKEDIDINKINEELKRAVKDAGKQIDREEIRKSIEEAKQLNMDEVKKTLEIVKEEMEKNKIDIKGEMKNAKKEIKKTKEILKEYQEMLDRMEKEGLINTKEDYRIEYKSGGLFINGQKQSQEILNRYKSYFKEDNMKIYKKNGEFNIDTN